jgi:hypothetical protein
MTTVATTNPQEAKQVSNPQDAKLIDASENPQDARLASGAARPWPEYNGRRVQLRDHLEIYLILNGYVRHVPDWETYQRLFKEDAPIDPIQPYVLDSISKGPALTSRTMLIRGDEVNKTYLLVDKVKMWIPNPTVFEQYHFDMAQCCVLPQFVVDFITTAPDNVEGPHR